MQSDVVILSDCLAEIVRADFDPRAVSPLVACNVGQAAVRLALDALRLEPEAMSHPLGFVRVPLTAWSLSAPRAAVHIWDQRFQLHLADDVHDHCYNFVSICLVGGLRHRIFGAGAGSSDRSRTMSSATYTAGSCADAGDEREEATIAELDSFEVAAPQIYGLAHHLLHSAEPLGKLTATVQFQSPCRKGQARVFRATPTSVPQRLDAAAPTGEELIRVLGEILTRLSPCHQ